jgi:predicted DNA-binding transcriptional regulator AlpA
MKLLPDKKVCERYGVTTMTLYRWDRDPDLAFPRPIKIRNRNYRTESELDEFDARMKGSPQEAEG